MRYLGLALVFLVPGVVVSVLAGRRARGRWWSTTALTLAALLVLTVGFDSLMIWADLFRYEESHLVGLTVLLAPVEDLAWPLAAGLLLPALWEMLRRRRPPDEEEQR